MENPNLEHISEDLTDLMNGMFKVLSIAGTGMSPETLRAKIVAANLKGMVNVILIGDDPESSVKVNLKAVCLGLLSVADWIDPEEVPDAFPGDAGSPQS